MTIKRELDEFTLTKGERILTAGLSSGEEVVISPSRPSATAGEERQISGAFLRYILTGGCEGLWEQCDRMPEQGLQIIGARITGKLDLEGVKLDHDLLLINCHFDEAPLLRSTRLDTLYLNGSHLPGLSADRLEARGDVFLGGVEVEGAIRLLGAKLGGGLDCDGARLRAGGQGDALSADRLEAKGSVFLRGVEAEGEIRLLGANLGGDLDCDGARLSAGEQGDALSADRLEARGNVFLRGVEAEGAIRLHGANLGGDLSCTGARLETLHLQGAKVDGAFYLRKKARVSGLLDLTDARFGSIVDVEECWPGQGGLVLDGCCYERFGGLVTAEARIRWLDLQDPARWSVDFWPQPWEQCAKVLREMGHAEEARKVLIEKEKRQRAAVRRASGKVGSGSERALAWLLAVMVFAALSWEAGSLLSFAALSAGAAVLVAAHVPAIRDALFGALIAYGHRPRRAFLWLAVAWFIGGVLFQAAADQGQIKPNNVRAVMSAAWSGCAGAANQPECFLEAPEGASYPRFNAWIYSADTLLPIVDLELQSYWIPAEEAGPLGAFARWFLWAQIAFGWALSLLAVAGFSGLIRRD